MALQKTILDESLSMYLQAVVSDIKQKGTMPTLFPPSELQLEELNGLVRSATVTYLSSSVFFSCFNFILPSHNRTKIYRQTLTHTDTNIEVNAYCSISL